jgi:hypothetical protein
MITRTRRLADTIAGRLVSHLPYTARCCVERWLELELDAFLRREIERDREERGSNDNSD